MLDRSEPIDRQPIVSAAPFAGVIRVLLTARYPLLLEGITRVLEDEHDVCIVASCGSDADLLPAIRRHRPDVVILDDDVAYDRRAVFCAVRSGDITTRIVLLAGALSDAEILEAIRLGAGGIVPKTMGSDRLIECVRKVHAGGTWLEAESMGRALDRMVRQTAALRAAMAVLTPRELQVVRMAGARRSTTEIADSLSLSKGTIKVHFHNIYQKLRVKGRLALTLYAQDNGLL
jgi:two-component system, NarL family, nitrate/nitrite response regulator NarL